MRRRREGDPQPRPPASLHSGGSAPAARRGRAPAPGRENASSRPAGSGKKGGRAAPAEAGRRGWSGEETPGTKLWGTRRWPEGGRRRLRRGYVTAGDRRGGGTWRGAPGESRQGERGQPRGGTRRDGEGQEATAAPSPTKEAVAEAVPDAAGGVPHPAAPQAGHEGKAHAEDGHQQVAEADVDEEEVGRRAEPLELVVEHQHQQVVAQAQHADGGDEQRQQLVGAGAEEGPLARHLLLRRRGLRAARHARAVPGVHGSRLSAAHSPAGAGLSLPVPS